jgi:ribose transport system substrate-binding protein
VSLHNLWSLRGVSVAAVTVAAAVGVAACGTSQNAGGAVTAGGSSSAPDPGHSGTKTIAFGPGIDPEGYFISMNAGIQTEAKKLGGYNIILQGSPQYSPETQVPILQALLTKHLDAAIVAPTDVTALDPTLNQYKQDGIPLFLGDAGVADASLPVAVVQTDNYEGGVAAADAMAKAIGDHGTVAIESFVPGSGSGAPRVSGFQAEMKKYPGITVLPVQYGKSDLSLAASQVGAELTAHPDLAGVFGANDASALGAGEAVHGAGRKVVVVAYDADPDEVKNLKSGLFDILIAQHPYDEGVILMQEINDYFHGKKSAIKPMTRTPVTVVTRANMNDPSVAGYLYGVSNAR